MWNQKLRELRRLEREVMQELCTRSPENCKPVRNEAGMSGQQKRRCTGGGNTFKQCLTTKSHSTCQRWSLMTNLTSGQFASHIEIKNGISYKTGRLQDVTIYHQR